MVLHIPCWLIIIGNHSDCLKHPSSRAHPLTSFNLISLTGDDLHICFTEEIQAPWAPYTGPWLDWTWALTCLTGLAGPSLCHSLKFSPPISPHSRGNPNLTVHLSLRCIHCYLVPANLDLEYNTTLNSIFYLFCQWSHPYVWEYAQLSLILTYFL